jgi:hypothetical protein
MQLHLSAPKNASIIMVLMSAPMSQDMKVMPKAMEEVVDANLVP